MALQNWSRQNNPDPDVAATWLAEAGLAGPAYLMLQSARPVSFLLGQGLLFLEPLLPFSRWRQTAGCFATLLTDRSRLQEFLSSLEAHLQHDGKTQDEENN